MAQPSNTLHSNMGWSSADKIVVKGFDLPSELLGHINLGDMAFLEMMDRLPTLEESTVFNALLVALVEHGITPSALATRITHLGAPESLQGSVAAGLLGLGSVFVGTIEGSAKFLQETLNEASPEADLAALAQTIVEQFRVNKTIIPGLGHPIHKPVDPRTPRLFEIAAENGFSGQYIALMQQVETEAQRQYDRMLPINATGAIGAIASELGIPWQVCRGLGVMARAIGLVGHVLEEMRTPIARDVWHRTETEATEHLKPDA
ncbi:MAG: citryl-CoA lyase [Chloroflexota bacterium]